MFSRRFFSSELDWYRLAFAEPSTKITQPSATTPDPLRILGSYLSRASDLGIGLAVQRRLCRLLVRNLVSRQQRDNLTTIICGVLGEPERTLRHATLDWYFYRALGHSTWASVPRYPVDFPELAAVNRYLREQSRGILLSSIHMGDYIRILTVLAPGLRDKKVHLLRRKEATAEEQRTFAHFEAAGIDYAVIRPDEHPARQAIAALRAGQVVAVLSDLSARWGTTQPITFCGRQLHWVKGPAQIALAGNAITLPIYSHFTAAGVLRITVAQPVRESSKTAAGASGQRTRCLTQQLARCAERQIKAHPAQWHHWRLIPEMTSATYSGHHDNPGAGD